MCTVTHAASSRPGGTNICVVRFLSRSHRCTSHWDFQTGVASGDHSLQVARLYEPAYNKRRLARAGLHIPDTETINGCNNPSCNCTHVDVTFVSSKYCVHIAMRSCWCVDFTQEAYPCLCTQILFATHLAVHIIDQSS